MHRQIAVTLLKIASRSSTCMTRGLRLQKGLQFQVANESVVWRNNEVCAHFMKKCGSGSLERKTTTVKPINGSTAWHKHASSGCNLNAFFRLDKKIGLGIGTSLLKPNAYFLGVPCRTLKTGKNGVEFRIPLQKLGASTATAMLAAPSEELNALLKHLPPSEANAIIGLIERYNAAHSSHASEKSGTYRRPTLQLLLALAVLGTGTLLFPTLVALSFDEKIVPENAGNNAEGLCEAINVTFNDVKGVDEAKSELQEVVEFLRDSDKFTQLGGTLPKGILLVGPPGTGKTLLARAVAGEAGVPFFHIAGPEFEGISGGEGAGRVRDLFKAAKAKAPCVIFIDEIDSVGAKRTNSASHPGANQTLNQLLSEMDGPKSALIPWSGARVYFSCGQYSPKMSIRQLMGT